MDTMPTPSRGGHITPGVSMRDPNEDWQAVAPGWGQFPQLMDVEWGGERAEHDVRIVKAPVVVERIGHPDRPAPSNHGGR